jgi:competence protein ComEC
LFDTIGAGAPFWWLAGKSLELLLALAHWTAGMPGAVTMMPEMGEGAFALFVLGGLWLALWRGRVRLLGLVPAMIGLTLLAQVRAPDLLISGDGRHVGITGEAEGELLVLRDSKSDYTRDNLTETAGMSGTLRTLDDWPGAHCTEGYCAVTLRRGGRDWQLLLARGKTLVPERALASACERADVVVSERYLPWSCKPRWLRADRGMLEQSGGLTIDLERGRIRSVAEDEGRHGWWNPPQRLPRKPRGPEPSGSAEADAAAATIQPQ